MALNEFTTKGHISSGILIARTLLLALAFAVMSPNAPLRADDDTRMGLNAPEKISFAGETLVLNGEGRRISHYIVLYGCAFYLPERGVAYEDIETLRSPMAFRVEVTFGMLPADMPASWVDELRGSVTGEEFRILTTIYRNLDAGDVVVIWYEPELGTVIKVNDVQRLAVKSRFLMNAFVSLWLSDDPVSHDLRTALLSFDDQDS